MDWIGLVCVVLEVTLSLRYGQMNWGMRQESNNDNKKDIENDNTANSNTKIYVYIGNGIVVAVHVHFFSVLSCCFCMWIQYYLYSLACQSAATFSYLCKMQFFSSLFPSIYIYRQLAFFTDDTQRSLDDPWNPMCNEQHIWPDRKKDYVPHPAHTIPSSLIMQHSSVHQSISNTSSILAFLKFCFIFPPFSF